MTLVLIPIISVICLLVGWIAARNLDKRRRRNARGGYWL